MTPFRKWLYVKAFNAVAYLAPPREVQAVHREVFSRGMSAYDEARRVAVDLRADLK